MSTVDTVIKEALPRAAHASRSSALPAFKIAAFVVGCILLALPTAHVGDFHLWATHWGTAPTVAAFIATVAMGVALFWAGARGLITGLIGY
ncbi:MAG: hypothetical protein QM673_00570 [Gordonia sp. (in: high G+C Gram-positive bacteria)]